MIPIRRAVRRTHPVLLLMITLSAGLLISSPNQIPAAHALPAAARTIGLGIYNSGWNDGVNPANPPLAIYNGTSVTMFLVNGNGARHQFRINTTPAITSPVLRADTTPMIFGFTASPIGTFTYCDVYNATACGTFQIKTLGDVNGDSVVNNLDLSSVTSYNGSSLSSTWNSGDVPYLHGVVDYTDLYVVVFYFGTTGPWPSPYHPDINGDGTVDITDLVTVSGQIGHVAPAPFNNPNQGPDINYDNTVNNIDISTVIANGADTRATNDSPNKSQYETSVTLNPNDPSNAVVVAMDNRDGVQSCYLHVGCDARSWFYLYITFNGGLSWKNIRLPGGPKNATTVIANDKETDDPSVAFDSNDHLFVGGIALDSDRIFVSRYHVNRSAGTANFETTSIVDVSSGRFLDKPWIAVDSSTSTVYIGYWDSEGITTSSVLMAHSTNLGNTFSITTVEGSPGFVEPSSPNFFNLRWSPYPTPVPAPGGKVYMAYFSGANQIRIAGSTNGGVTFTSPSPQKAVDILLRPTDTLTNIIPSITTTLSATANPVTGDLYVTWEDYRNNATRGAEIMFSSSTNGGSTWTAPITVDDDTSTGDQFFPVIAAGGRNTGDRDISIIFYDRRINGESSPLIDVYYARSIDGGVTWLANKRISDLSFTANQVASGFTGTEAMDFLGDYIGLSASTLSGDTIVVRASWADTRLSDYGDIFSDVRSFKAGQVS